ncbi:SMI1/KNR4 family protein [Clostridium tarantellae]|uniref:SMI1/KNR4 family protein n=1 Tax=Clostridium tarantellae TaxID=39493 RepID=A0A6I1MSG0_9CLOT|nr:SMI1/KNR4 family protein [Clostridium tarantellae]
MPIAEDPFGNLICFDYRTTNKPTIVFLDHEKAFNNKNLALCKICNSFNELLAMLHESNE